MPIAEYRRKRNFKKTPEPSPGRGNSSPGNSYLIQKHAATRLHYDLRLELDGVLLSWAVTKGPSSNPAEKRLAVRTEDHPLSYGKFEGTIPKGEYGGGTVMLWDRGTWEPKGDPHSGIRKGHLAFILHGERLKGAWDLIRMRSDEKKENWLLIKHKDADSLSAESAHRFLETEASSISTGRSMEEISLGAPLPKSESTARGNKILNKLVREFPRPELATLVDSPPEGGEWLHEIKFDGYRLLAFLADGQVRLRTRNENDWTQKFPTLQASVARLEARTAVIDMEAVMLDPNGRSSFQALQHALGDGGNRQGIQAFAFDLLELNGKDLTREPLLVRKKKLRALLHKSKHANFLHFSDHLVGQGAEMVAKSCAMGLEGIVSKLIRSTYQAGRQTSWAKSKCLKRQEFVIVGYTAANRGNRAIGALHLGYNEDGALKYAGKVGTGFDMREAQKLYERLSALQINIPPVVGLPRNRLGGSHWVKPSVLCEVAFTEWTEDGHIRHPSFQGLREDKVPQDVTRERSLVKRPKRSSPPKKNNSLTVRGVAVSHRDRVIFKDTGLTKGELAEYYGTIAPWILKDIADHPLSLLRCPEGISHDCFFQRSTGTGLGKDVEPFVWKHNGKSYEYFYVSDEKGLVECVQMGAIELHPWGSCVDNIEYPNRIVFDLDPDESVPFEAVKLAAVDLRQRLKKKKLDSFVKCTGGKGLHVTATIVPEHPWERVKAFCAELAAEMVRNVPSAYVATMSKAKRKGKIFVDYFRNDHTATAIADFSVRARPGAPVAMPLDWIDLDDLRAANQFSVPQVAEELKRKKPNLSRYKPQRLRLTS